jgi:hypothetical protein
MLTAFILFLAASCDVFMSNYRDDDAEGNLTISLGNSAGTGESSRAISTAEPAFPALSAVTISVTKDGAWIASGTFTGSGPYTLSVPAGSGYRVELDAQAEIPNTSTLGFRYAGAADNVSTGSPAYISLSVAETAVIARRSPNTHIYRSLADVGTSTRKALPASPSPWSYPLFFFDRYGRFFFNNNGSGIGMLPFYEATSFHSSYLDFSGINYGIAHPQGTDMVYLCTDVDADSDVDLVFTRLSGLAGTNPIAATKITVPPAVFSGDFSGFAITGPLGAEGAAVFIGVTEGVSPPRTGFIRGTVDTGAKTFTFTGGKILSGLEKITDMMVINGTLYVLGYPTGTNKEQRLYAYNPNTLARIGVVPIQSPTAITGTFYMEANIAGWGKNEMYVYYYAYGTNTSGIIKIDTMGNTISGRKDW